MDNLSAISIIEEVCGYKLSQEQKNCMEEKLLKLSKSISPKIK
jgi:hypothetical protein